MPFLMSSYSATSSVLMSSFPSSSSARGANLKPATSLSLMRGYRPRRVGFADATPPVLIFRFHGSCEARILHLLAGAGRQGRPCCRHERHQPVRRNVSFLQTTPSRSKLSLSVTSLNNSTCVSEKRSAILGKSSFSNPSGLSSQCRQGVSFVYE